MKSLYFLSQYSFHSTSSAKFKACIVCQITDIMFNYNSKQVTDDMKKKRAYYSRLLYFNVLCSRAIRRNNKFLRIY